MIDERFLLEEFEARGRNSEESGALARQLQVAIATELLPDVRVLGEAIASKLRELGHSVAELEFEVEEENGAISVAFVDPSEGSERSLHRLRFNLDLVISVGFPGYREA